MKNLCWVVQAKTLHFVRIEPINFLSWHKRCQIKDTPRDSHSFEIVRNLHDCYLSSAIADLPGPARELMYSDP
ncbi:hypothetical protein AWB70_05036 [Caballeronia cordobensis]|uniref:Uncharacterized protein n=1 Tax=Caballeronia cordobensis TaxID=1353886 RepID=A0A158ILJ3_CABCO|nr:hypothetical protein AWB70_05036 [Caballeronia cordobensis]